MRIYKGENGRQFRRVSRWIKIKTDFVTVRHSLAEYGDRDGVSGCSESLEKMQ